MRGKLASALRVRGICGITPADAGKTCRQELKTKDLTGSPPRMRGKPRRPRQCRSRRRITPADAGKTRRMVQLRLHFRDHPRGCGENCAELPKFCLFVGSPPRMRGKQEIEKMTNATIRITPADAGKTNISSRERRAFEDHPRGCGENPKSSYVGLLAKGSPPRMRGKLPQ